MVSMKDVAVECGVSIATVSKALNDHSDISEETRRKVKEAANRLGYTVISSSKNDIKATQTALVPIGDNCELDKLTIKNTGNAAKHLSIYSYIEFCLWNAVDDCNNFQRNFSTGEVEVQPEITIGGSAMSTI